MQARRLTYGDNRLPQYNLSIQLTQEEIIIIDQKKKSWGKMKHQGDFCLERKHLTPGLEKLFLPKDNSELCVLNPLIDPHEFYPEISRMYDMLIKNDEVIYSKTFHGFSDFTYIEENYIQMFVDKAKMTQSAYKKEEWESPRLLRLQGKIENVNIFDGVFDFVTKLKDGTEKSYEFHTIHAPNDETRKMTNTNGFLEEMMDLKGEIIFTVHEKMVSIDYKVGISKCRLILFDERRESEKPDYSEWYN